jgi:hypothetical protein
LRFLIIIVSGSGGGGVKNFLFTKKNKDREIYRKRRQGREAKRFISKAMVETLDRQK